MNTINLIMFATTCIIASMTFCGAMGEIERKQRTVFPWDKEPIGWDILTLIVCVVFIAWSAFSFTSILWTLI